MTFTMEPVMAVREASLSPASLPRTGHGADLSRRPVKTGGLQAGIASVHDEMQLA